MHSAFTVQDVRTDDEDGECPSVFLCAVLGDLSSAGLGCELRILIVLPIPYPNTYLAKRIIDEKCRAPI